MDHKPGPMCELDHKIRHLNVNFDSIDIMPMNYSKERFIPYINRHYANLLHVLAQRSLTFCFRSIITMTLKHPFIAL